MSANKKLPGHDVNMLLGVCGSISAVAVPHMLAWMRLKLGLEQVRVVMTRNAESLMGRQAMRSFSSASVLVDWSDADDHRVPHVSLANSADVLLIMPASVNFLGKIANGIADDLLTSTVMAAYCPTVIVPTSNAAMWEKPSVQRNVSRLREDGYDVVQPKDGFEVEDGSPDFGSMGDYRLAVVRAVSKAIVFRGAKDAAASTLYAEDGAAESTEFDPASDIS